MPNILCQKFLAVVARFDGVSRRRNAIACLKQDIRLGYGYDRTLNNVKRAALVGLSWKTVQRTLDNAHANISREQTEQLHYSWKYGRRDYARGKKSLHGEYIDLCIELGCYRNPPTSHL